MPALASAGVDEGKARFVPWSGYWWPHTQGGLAVPAGKYDQCTGHKAADWERKNHPKAGADKWWGFCHAWSASALMEKEPTQSMTVKDMRGRPIQLSVGDQKGILAAAHSQDVANFFGQRYRGKPGDDYQDLYPDVLWKYLKMYIKTQGIPVVLDSDAGTQVWNFPTYYYRVEYNPAGSGDLYNCSMTIYMADDGVKADFVGTKVRKNTYQFTCRMKNGSVIAGSGKWVGASVKDHPDFGWYPYITKPENPEIKYAEVITMLGLHKEVEVNANPDPIANPENPPQPPEATSAPPGPEGRITVGANEMITLVTNKTSAFNFQIQVDGFKREYVAGEPYSIMGTSQKAGYLYLFHVAPDGEVKLIFPVGKQDNRIPTNDKFTIGAPGNKENIKFTCPDVPGQHLVRAIVTTKPLLLSGLDDSTTEQQQTQSFHLPQTQKDQVHQLLKSVLVEHTKKPGDVEEEVGTKADKVVGEFAQGEAAIYVGREKPKEDKPKPDKEKPSRDSVEK
jgi:hypothetical protein